MLVKRIYLCVCFILITLNLFASEVEDFEVACQIFTEAQNTAFDRDKRSAYIEDNLNTRTSSKELISTYHAIFNLTPQERYAVFKQSAEHITGKTWNCPAAKALLR